MSFTLAFALQLRKKHGKTSVRVRKTENDKALLIVMVDTGNGTPLFLWDVFRQLPGYYLNIMWADCVACMEGMKSVFSGYQEVQLRILFFWYVALGHLLFLK